MARSVPSGSAASGHCCFPSRRTKRETLRAPAGQRNGLALFGNFVQGRAGGVEQGKPQAGFTQCEAETLGHAGECEAVGAVIEGDHVTWERLRLSKITLPERSSLSVRVVFITSSMSGAWLKAVQAARRNR